METICIVRIVYGTDDGLEYMEYDSFPKLIDITDDTIFFSFVDESLSIPKDMFVDMEVFR